MTPDAPFAWIWLAGLGAIHGLNPGMGWLFAVALGLQERRARAVWRALLPLALGHALAIAAAVVPAALLGLVLPAGALKWLVAAALLSFAIYRLRRRGHPHFGGMRVGMRELTVWSLLMASAHGAGLMVLPLLLPPDPAPVVHASVAMPSMDHAGGDHSAHLQMAMGPASDGTDASRADQSARPVAFGIFATLVHTAGYLVVTGFLAFVVYAWAGLRLLRSAWINMDLIWIGALIVTALVTPLMG
jgi:hypothetical protein